MREVGVKANRIDEMDNPDEFKISIIDAASESMYSRMKQHAADDMRDHRLDIANFEKYLIQDWGVPLNLLEYFIVLIQKIGKEWHTEFIRDAQEKSNYMFEALITLFARACQISSAILVLLRSGYPDDAHARWRSLYELEVFSLFICTNNQELAERYIRHGVFQRYKMARQDTESREVVNKEVLRWSTNMHPSYS